MQSILHSFRPIQLLEIFGTFFMLLGVWLTARKQESGWLVSIVGLILYVFIFFKSKLYADACLQAIYIFMSGYGWYQWKQNAAQEVSVSIVNTTIKQHVLFISISIAIGLFIYGALHFLTDSDLPFLDAFTTSFSLVATYMMAKSFLQCWWYWVAIDLVYTIMYCYKFLHITALQYLVFTLLAVYGYAQWRKELDKIG